MTINSKIAWTDTTWNPIRGCSKVSLGCTNCYAERMAARFAGPGQPYVGLIKNGHWNGTVRLVTEHLGDPLRWKQPRRIFVNSMSDLFHESLAFEDIASIFGIMAASPRHTFQILTKRPAQMLEFFQRIQRPRLDVRDFGTWPLPNVWIGVSVENQQTADERIPILLQVPAAVRWVSLEPLLGPVDLDLPRCEIHDRNELSMNGSVCNGCASDGYSGELSWGHWLDPLNGGISWVVAGGESGPSARPSNPSWFRSLRDQCAEAGVPFLFKQWGEWAPRLGSGGVMFRCGKNGAGRLLDDVFYDEYPTQPNKDNP
jgi:protein gp37